MKICPNCNNSNQDFDITCNNCGAKLDPLDNLQNTFTPSDSYNGNKVTQTGKTNILAIISLILAILSIPLNFCCCLGLITAIFAIVLGYIARNQIKESSGLEKGNNLALAGIIIGFILIFLTLVLLIFSFLTASGKLFWDSFWEGLKEGLKEEI